MSKDGRKPKDAALTPNLDKKGGLTKSDRASLKAQLDRKKKELRAAKKASKQDGQLDAEAGKQKPKKSSDEDRMLADMWWVYKNVEFTNAAGKKVTGRQKLLELAQQDDRFYLAMVKELLRIEAQRKDSGGGGEQKTVFVVLKGLHDDEVQEDNGGGSVDHRQIMAAIDPTAEDAAVAVGDGGGKEEGDEFAWLRPENQK